MRLTPSYPDHSHKGSGAMPGKRLTIIHGYTASPHSHWFPWLQQQLSAQGIAVDRLPMPAPRQPRLDAWVDFIGQRVTNPDRNHYFIAHSLGCIALLRHLQTLSPGTEIGGMILVSGFASTLPNLPELDAFNPAPLDSSKLIRCCPQRVVFASTNDRIVPSSHSESLSRQLQARLRLFDHAGHFLASDGFLQFPPVLDELQHMLTSPPV
jgi:predicted alpha/beta hydrolase family esterase